MTDDMTRGEGIRGHGPREPREADARRDGRKAEGGATPPDTTTAAGATGTHAAVVPGEDARAARTGDRTAVPGARTRAPGTDTGPGPVAREDHVKAPGRGGAPSGSGSSLLSHDESDKLTARLHHAVGGFVDEPRSAVEEADHVLEEATAHLTDVLARRRRTLRAAWHPTDDDRATPTDTEQLRLALRDYRELTERLLRL
ncbi:hypothetical protein [Streptomyces griseiscabiei]|uniref:Uncharacterized protein n=1 Tax=Streptomyces griseiscabiei TaxID=2993540 RepID=A0ABU4KWA0_9ACTN|nr:hypothetical protein [Streptomyces griseiscabiei]MBZ3903409.1 hypothetical protein [Streptomyces griseiscabiei]MDX2907722.1 hypothetical protein [Streptomyces griseiscabiei]